MPFLSFRNIRPQGLVALVLGLSLTAVLAIAVHKLESSTVTNDFHRRAESRILALKTGLQDAEADLVTVSRLFAVAGPLSRDQFRSFVSPLLKAHPHVRNFTFQRLISAAVRPEFEAERRRLDPGFAITEVVDYKLVPAAKRAQYRVIDYVEPFQENMASFGLDASTRHEQSQAALRACRTGLPSATRPYTLVHHDLTMWGFVILAPLYRQGSMPDDPDARCANLVGYVSAIFDAQKLVENALERRRLLHTPGFAVAIYAAGWPVTDNLVYRSEGPKPGALPVLARLVNRLPEDQRSTFEVAGLDWTVVVSAVPRSILKVHLASLLTLLGGILTSVLASAYMQSLVVRAERARQLNEERLEKLAREQAMRDRNLQLEEERAYLRTLFDQAPGFIAVLDGPAHVFQIANCAYYELVGKRDIIGKSVRDALPELEGQNVFELLDHVYATGETFVDRNRAVALVSDDEASAKTRHIDFICQPMTDAHGRVTAIFVQGNDISLQNAAQRKLEYLAGHDQVTGLPNGQQMLEHLKQMIGQAKEEDGSLYVMLIDIDRFKSANERFGSSAAAAILKIVAERLSSIFSVMQEKLLLGRLEGNKFLLIVPIQGEESGYLSVIQDIRAAIGTKIDIDGHTLFLTCSIGIAKYPADGDSADALAQYADIAMYCAKELGNNNFQFYTAQQNERIRERLKIEVAMRSAVERSEFVLHYQPQLDLSTGQIIAMEALIRWDSPELGMLSPNAFIEIAEETGLIVPIGDWALCTACAQMKAWQRAGFGTLRVAVNLSARQFAQENLAARIREILKENALDPRYLDLELTESLVMTDVDKAVAVLKELSELGVQLSIDDFGTGYSSLAQLKRFPVNLLKIDRSFIRDIPQNGNDAAIADAIISMAHSLGMRVLAEGVETEVQCEFLARNMCDEIQGFLFSKAVPAEQIEVLLRESRCLPEHLLRERKPERKLLLVDDEPGILSALRRQLRLDGYKIMTACDGASGLEVLAQTKIDVIVSDQRMPGMTGVEFLRKVKTLYPDTVRIVLSGFTELQSVTDAVNEGAIYKFLTKPWDDNQLRGHIAHAFQHKEMADENRRLNLQVRVANQGLASANRELETALLYKQQQIQRREISLDIVREALQHVPMPIIGLDEDQIIAFANGAACELFDSAGAMLGTPIAELIPVLANPMPEDISEQSHEVGINGTQFNIVSRRMGQGTQSRGSLIVFTRGEQQWQS
ncbi:MAG TPA: EAL domain-containing protein [Oxalicibacterium sp.]|nr:EAL domain-containing protein [Oxalicibacterium sp.]